jgi:type VI protein secretion system component VasK
MERLELSSREKWSFRAFNIAALLVGCCVLILMDKAGLSWSVRVFVIAALLVGWYVTICVFGGRIARRQAGEKAAYAKAHLVPRARERYEKAQEAYHDALNRKDAAEKRALEAIEKARACYEL